MHASLDVAACEPFQLLASLEQQAARRDFDSNAPAITQPHKQARKAGSAMYGQEVEVIVIASIAHIECVMSLQVSACRHRST